jgi:hypothetical protein
MPPEVDLTRPALPAEVPEPVRPGVAPPEAAAVPGRPARPAEPERPAEPARAAEPEAGGPGAPRKPGEPEDGGPGKPRGPEDEFAAEVDRAIDEATAALMISAPAGKTETEFGLRLGKGQVEFFGIEPGTGMTVQEYRFLARRGLPPLDAAGRPIAGPLKNVKTRLRIHSPDPTAPPDSNSRRGWTVGIEQGDLRMTGDGVWFNSRFVETPTGRHEASHYTRNADGEWVHNQTGQAADPHLRTALNNWDANMAASHIPLFPEPPAGRQPPPTPEPTKPPPGPEPEPLAVSRRTAEQAAGEIPGSRFTAMREMGEHALGIPRAVDDLITAGLQGKPTVEPYDGISYRMSLDADNGQRVKVRIVESDPELGRTPKGELRVAWYERTPQGDYIVHVSKGALAMSTERAIAHELTEIRSVHGTDGDQADALAPGSKATTLSPDDRGRVAELEVLARQIERPPRGANPEVILDEAQRLVTHLGLTGDTEGAISRRSLVLAALEGNETVRAFLERAVSTAADNPFLQRLKGELPHDLKILAGRVAHAERLGERPRVLEALREQVLEQARLLVLAEGLLARTPRGEKSPGGIDPVRIAKLREGLPAEVHKLLDDAVRLAQTPLGEKPLVGTDPGDMDPHTAAATRADYGDRKFFQDWPTFRDAYFNFPGSSRGEKRNDPRELRRLFIEWANGAYVDKGSGRMRSVVSGDLRPDPGYEHKFLIDPAADPASKLPPERIIPVKSKEDVVVLNETRQEIVIRDMTVEQAVQVRDQNMRTARKLRQELVNDARNDPARKPVLEEQIKLLEENLKYASEALGVAAGQAVAQQRYKAGRDVPMPGGRDVPDILRFMPPEPGGKIVVIECKGGDSPLGTRTAVDGVHITEQGNREYLRSLAKDMAGKPDPVGAAGRQILKALESGAPIEYVVVRQPFDPATGAPLDPEVGTFDLSHGPAKP